MGGGRRTFEREEDTLPEGEAVAVTNSIAARKERECMVAVVFAFLHGILGGQSQLLGTSHPSIPFQKAWLIRTYHTYTPGMRFSNSQG